MRLVVLDRDGSYRCYHVPTRRTRTARSSLRIVAIVGGLLLLGFGSAYALAKSTETIFSPDALVIPG